HRARSILILMAWLCLSIGGAVAQETAAPPSLDAMRSQLTRLNASLDQDPDAEALTEARDAALLINEQAEAAAVELEPQLNSVDARLAELGAVPEDPAAESEAVRSARKRLGKRRNDIDAQIRQARVLAVEATQAADRIV